MASSLSTLTTSRAIAPSLLRMLVSLLLFAPGYAAQDAHRLLAPLDGCPLEESNCTRLTLDDTGNVVVCPHKLWIAKPQLVFHVASRTTTVTTMWFRQWGQFRVEYAKKGYKFVCAADKPEFSVEAFRPQISVTDYGGSLAEEPPAFFCYKGMTEFDPHQLNCHHGYCIADGKMNPACQCHSGWRGANCDEAYDPFGYASAVPRFPPTPSYAVRDTCNVLLAEGCPDEERDDCVKLRFKRRAPEHVVHCPRKLWISTGNAWQSINDLFCENKRWRIASNNTFNGTLLEPQNRVRCAHDEPKEQPVSMQPGSLTSHPVPLASTQFCFRNSARCFNNGKCVHSIQKGKETRTYCSCDAHLSGEHCELLKPDNSANFPSCSPLLAEGCPWEYSQTGACEKLKLTGRTMGAVCPWKLWVSNTQLIYHKHARTHTHTTNWTTIDKLWCKDNTTWTISFHKANGRRREDPLTLGRKVMCANERPTIEADAFWEHRKFVPTPENFAQVSPTPLAFCPDKPFKKDCYKGTCVIKYKNGQFIATCQCKFGWQGEECKEHIDPYGFEAYGNPHPKKGYNGLGPGEKRVVKGERRPDANIARCEIRRAEGCPDEMYDECTKLRYYDKRVVCTSQLWQSTGNHEWAKIDKLECNAKNQWEISNSTHTKEILADTSRVQCSKITPTRRTSAYAFRDEEGDTYRGVVFCFHKFFHYCYNGNCVYWLNSDSMAMVDRDGFPDRSYPTRYCTCPTMWSRRPEIAARYNYSYDGEFCDSIVVAEKKYDFPEDYHPPSPKHSHDDIRNVTVEVCDPSDLEDGCKDGQCDKLKANSTHVKCRAQLWLNYGGDFLLDWHEIDGVKCVDNVWTSACSRKIGRSLLTCSSTRPSALSASLWLTLIITAIALILSVGLACVMCLLCRRKRRIEQVYDEDARAPHSSRCASSSQNSSKE